MSRECSVKPVHASLSVVRLPRRFPVLIVPRCLVPLSPGHYKVNRTCCGDGLLYQRPGAAQEEG